MRRMRSLLLGGALPLIVGCTSPLVVTPRPSAVPSQLSFDPLLQRSVSVTGSTVRLSARLRGQADEPIEGAALTFNSSSGTVSPATAVTDSLGLASTTLAASEAVTVSVTDGGLIGRVSLGVATPFTLTIDDFGPQRFRGQIPVGVTITANTAGLPSPAAPSSVILTCAGRALALPAFVGAFGSTTAMCEFPSHGRYELTATASVGSWSTTSRSTIDVQLWKLDVGFDIFDQGNGNFLVAGVASGASDVAFRYEWRFNSERVSTEAPIVRRTLGHGTYTITVDAFDRAGLLIASGANTIRF